MFTGDKHSLRQLLEDACNSRSPRFGMLTMNEASAIRAAIEGPAPNEWEIEQAAYDSRIAALHARTERALNAIQNTAGVAV